MPLIDLKTELKSLKFTGPAPYVVKDINNPGPAAANIIQARLDDVSRISKMFADKPGITFLSKQGFLQASQLRDIDTVTLSNTIVPVSAKVGAILAQIPVNKTGTHFSAVELAGANATYLNTATAASDAKYSGRITGRHNSQFLNPVFRYKQLLKEGSFYATNVGKTAAANLAETNGEINIRRFTPDIQNQDIYSLAKQVSAGRSLEDRYGLTPKNDKVNLLKIGEDGDDLVPLKVNIVGNINSLVVFRGFYDNIVDNYNGSWSDTNYIGRAESLYTYSKFARTLSFSFKVPIFSEAEQDPVYNKVNTFVSFTAPTYSEDGYPAGTILQLQIGDYIKTNGVLNSVNVTVDNNVPWSVGGATKLLPQVLSLSVSFSVIHSSIPQVSLITTKPFIASGENTINLQQRETPTPQATAAVANGRARQQFQFGQELAQAANTFIRGLGQVSLPINARPRAVIEVGDGTFGPPIFDSNGGG